MRRMGDDNMGRATRVEIPGTIYHVISRGNNKNNIFLDDKDYNVFLKQLFEVKQEKEFSLYAYCIMPNHFHLLLETTQTPLSKIMQQLLTQYAIYFNSRYDRTGHVFQDRYKAKVCEKEEYLFKLIQYIHLNPLKAKIVRDINEYKWCSHLYFTGKIKNNNLSIEKLSSRMGCISVEEVYKFYNSLMKEFDAGNLSKHSTEDFHQSSLPDILKEVSASIKLPEEIILAKNKNRSANRARRVFTDIAVKNHGYSLKVIADFLNRDISVVTKYLKLPF